MDATKLDPSVLETPGQHHSQAIKFERLVPGSHPQGLTRSLTLAEISVNGLGRLVAYAHPALLVALPSDQDGEVTPVDVFDLYPG